MVRFSLLVSILFWLSNGAIKAQTIPLNLENKQAHHAEADLWLDTVFGHCFYQVSGETWADHPAERSGEWSDLRADYASTLVEPLNDPKQSALPSAVIIDLNDEKTSCWTQYSSLVPEYAGPKLVAIRAALEADDRLKKAYVDQGQGPMQVEVILAGESRVPVIFYQTSSAQGSLVTVVTIVQQTVPNFVYSD